MNPSPRFGSFSSSADPSKLGTTVQGFIGVMAVAIVYFAAKLFGIELTPENVTQFGTDLGFVITQMVIVYGLVRKFCVWAIDKWHTRTI